MSADQDERGTRARVADAITPDHGVLWVHRVGAVVVALVIATIGVLGFVGGLGFFDTEGATMAGGLSTNGALSTVSVVTAAILLAAAVRGGKLASTVMIVIGTLFLVSAFGNLAVIGHPVQPAGVPPPQRLLLDRRGPRAAPARGLRTHLVEAAAGQPLPPGARGGRRGARGRPPAVLPASPAEAAPTPRWPWPRVRSRRGPPTTSSGGACGADEARNHEDRRAIWMGFDGRDPDGEDRRGSGGRRTAPPWPEPRASQPGPGPCPVGRAAGPTWPRAGD